ncbi:MAG TPA: hypothetical protein VEV21_13120 [Burkholderiales bacterium]|nr:hypothetical protein [Burkholderiales bacterium]
MALKRKLLRRAAAGAAIVIGALLLWISPEQLLGVVTIVAGLVLEAIGVRLDHA